ncbi:MAG TPA: HD domain-containing protein [Candidatus Paceibacterota bacterium]
MSSVKEITSLMHNPSKEEIDLITRALTFAKEAHKDHKRNSGEPYFNHLFETARTLAELGMGPRSISAGFLHDSIEDVGIKQETIREQFGEDILKLVLGVTKLGTLKYRGLSRHTESLRKLFVAAAQDIRVVIIKLADRLHNMKTLQFVPKEKQKRIALETLEIYAPVAERLGMGRLKGELEDLAFPYVFPKEYEVVQKLLKQKSKENLKHLEKVNKSLKKELAKQGITNFETSYRIKHTYSLFRKLERKNWDIEKIHDISALRIIVPTVSDCYKILGVIHSNWRPLPGKIKDYIAFKKPNGYQSIHTTIFTGDGGIVEIQIRTREMHHRAEYGIASHIAYKLHDGEQTTKDKTENSNILWLRSLLPPIAALKRQIVATKNLSKKIGENYATPSAPSWVKQIAEAQQSSANSEDFMEALKTDFFTHRIFVFTPHGDVVDLPIDSSPIDFAYAIHSDIGNHLTGAKVNGKLTSLDTKLKNGNIVEIQTKASSKPTQKWLNVAKTSLARRHIRASLEEDQRK